MSDEQCGADPFENGYDQKLSEKEYRERIKYLMRCHDDSTDEIERLRRERDEATRYAENLAVALSRHFPHVPQWKPLTGDLIGLLTQIDNMTAGLSPARAALGEEKK